MGKANEKANSTFGSFQMPKSNGKEDDESDKSEVKDEHSGESHDFSEQDDQDSVSIGSSSHE